MCFYAKAKQYSALMDCDSTTYPIVYFQSDTTGEKHMKSFYTPNKKNNLHHIQVFGVVEQTKRHEIDEKNALFKKLKSFFSQDEFSKAQVVGTIHEFLLNFEHKKG